MMNGLQSLPQWEDYFNFPTKGKLGLLSSIQVSASRNNSLASELAIPGHLGRT
jgi:hypothetical protein